MAQGEARAWRRRLGIGLLIAATAVVTAVLCFLLGLGARGAEAGIRYSVPRSVSPQAHAIYERLIPLVAARNAAQGVPRTLEDFAALRVKEQAEAESRNAPLLKKLAVSAVETQFDGVGVLDIRPADLQDDGTAVIYVHGGAFVLGSARSSAGLAALLAASSGTRVLSVDYTVAPAGDWRRATGEVMTVYRALRDQGYAARGIGMLGESAGGNIVASSVLQLRDRGQEAPGAIVLLSPALDFNRAGDSQTTLAAADPVLIDLSSLDAALEAYAARADWTHPYVSPVYGDFTKGYPPVLLQLGTKEALLSDSVRLYRAIRAAGGTATLDVYEGMPHVFQAYMADTPEQKAAFDEVRRFWERHLSRREQ